MDWRELEKIIGAACLLILVGMMFERLGGKLDAIVQELKEINRKLDKK